MIRFLDGPAAGVALFLKRAPVYLRAVMAHDDGQSVEWDALDQLDDTPKDSEGVVAYKRVGSVGWVHIDRSNPRRGEWYRIGEYKLCAEQPAEEDMRDTARWRAWCVAQQGRDKGDGSKEETKSGA